MGAALKLSPRNRRRIELMVEQLIAVLDAIDGDPDLEPSLGAGMDRDQEDAWRTGAGQLRYVGKGRRRRLIEIEDCGHKEDYEPSLGSLEQIDQSHWGADPSPQPDLEWQCDDEGIDADREPEETDRWRDVPFLMDQTRLVLV